MMIIEQFTLTLLIIIIYAIIFYFIKMYLKDKDSLKLIFIISFSITSVYFIIYLFGFDQVSSHFLYSNFIRWLGSPVIYALFISSNAILFSKINRVKLFHLYLLILFFTTFAIFFPLEMVNLLSRISQLLAIEILIVNLYLFLRDRKITNLMFLFSIFFFSIGGMADLFNLDYMKYIPFLMGHLFIGVLFFVSKKYETHEDGLESNFSIRKEISRLKDELEAKELGFTQFFNNSPDYCYIISKKGKIIDINNAAVAAIGITKEELIGKKLIPTVYEKPYAKAYELVKKWLIQGYLENEEIDIKTKNGCKTVLLSVTDVRDSKGELLYSILIQKDITKIKNLEKFLIEKKNESEQLLNSMADGVRIIHKDFTIQNYNKKMVELAGFQPNEIKKGIKCYEMLPSQKNCQTANCPMVKVLRTGKGFSQEELRVNKKGEKIPTLELITPLKDHRGNIIGIIEDFRDVSILKEKQNKIERTLKMTKTILDGLPIGIMIVTYDKKIIRINDAALKMLGRTREGTIGRICNQTLCPANENKCPILDLGQSIDNSQRSAICKDGNVIPILKTVLPIVIDEKEVLLEAFVDISEITEKEKMLKKSEERLKETNKHLKHIDNIKNGFLNMTTHEMGTPITAIKGHSQILFNEKIGNVNDKQKKSLDIIKRNADRLNKLVQDILDFSKLENGTLSFEKTNTDIPQLIKEVIEDIATTSSEKEITIKSHIEDNTPNINIDKDRIKQVIINLLTNAIKFSPKKSIIDIIVNNTQNKVIFKIKDEGRGIPKEKIDHIFDLFYQIDKTKDSKIGSGLGLAISKGIIEGHNGTINAESKGKGTTFTITLPNKATIKNEKELQKLDIFTKN